MSEWIMTARSRDVQGVCIDESWRINDLDVAKKALFGIPFSGDVPDSDLAKSSTALGNDYKRGRKTHRFVSLTLTKIEEGFAFVPAVTPVVEGAYSFCETNRSKQLQDIYGFDTYVEEIYGRNLGYIWGLIEYSIKTQKTHSTTIVCPLGNQTFMNDGINIEHALAN